MTYALFFLGLIIGCCLGVAIMCLMYISREMNDGT